MGKRIVYKGSNCKVGGCGGVVRIGGLCSKHGMAFRRYGDVLGGKVGRIAVCIECGNEFRLIKSNQEYCSNVCYRKSEAGRKAAYEATKAYRLRNKEKLNARGIFRRHPFKQDANCLVCRTREKLHRHHHDYKNKMNVIVLCRKHHHELHSWDSN